MRAPLLVTLAFATCLPTPALAFYGTVEMCQWVNRISRETMRARQVGVPLHDMLGTSLVQPKHDLAKMLRGIVLDAYKVPRYEGKRNQENASNDFADAHYAACLEAISNDHKN